MTDTLCQIFNIFERRRFFRRLLWGMMPVTVLPRRKKGLFSLKNFFLRFFHPSKQEGIFAFLSSENSTLLVSPTFLRHKEDR
jgi:hypothetical protein